MNIDQAADSTTDGPIRVAIHGQPGTGKTTLAAYLPRPLFVGAEKGIPRDLGFRVKEVHPKSWGDLLDTIDSLTFDEHEYQSLVIDTVDWFEEMLHRFVCDRDSKRKTEMNPKERELVSIEDYPFGKGFLVAQEEFRTLLARLDKLQDARGMHVALLLHSTVRTFKNPSGPDFDRYEPKSHARISSLVREWAEAMLFIYFRVDASKISEDKERNKIDPSKARAKGIGGTDRIVGTRNCAMYDAKNRSGMADEIELRDPNVIVGALLGEHLERDHAPVADRRERETPKHNRDSAGKRANGNSTSAAAPPAQREPEPARRDDYVAEKPAQRPPPKQRDAHPNAPRDSEPQNGNGGFDRAREHVEQRDQQRLTDTKQSPAEAAIEAALRDAARSSAEYGAKVEKWVSRARVDKTKAGSLPTIDDVNERLFVIANKVAADLGQPRA